MMRLPNVTEVDMIRMRAPLKDLEIESIPKDVNTYRDTGEWNWIDI